MPLPEPQPCMSQDCLFQKVTAPGQYWEMASRTSQAEFSHVSQKSDESKRWVSLHAQKYWCASFLTQIKTNWAWRGWKRKKWEQRRFVCAQGMRVDPQPLSELISPHHSSLLQMFHPGGYKTTSPVTVTHLGHITTQPGLHIMAPESKPATSPQLPGKALHSISLSKTMNHNCRNNMIISIYKTNWTNKLSTD